jgi:hypothetical protein
LRKFIARLSIIVLLTAGLVVGAGAVTPVGACGWYAADIGRASTNYWYDPITYSYQQTSVVVEVWEDGCGGRYYETAMSGSTGHYGGSFHSEINWYGCYYGYTTVSWSGAVAWSNADTDICYADGGSAGSYFHSNDTGGNYYVSSVAP